MITPTLISNLAWKGYLIFMALNFAFIPLVYFCYPGTANLTLEETGWLFLEGHVVNRSIHVAKHGWQDSDGMARHLGPSESSTEDKAEVSQLEATQS
ncbi:hypothetical protein GGR56DRAFT_80677 [Xylariaceae sp. FL0804]|nr:hypothetical protein GGR56DRAFT_80677 [Xylariaceae sp. FL0804]